MPFPSPRRDGRMLFPTVQDGVISMNAPEDRADAADAWGEETERESQPTAVERRDEKPAVEAYDPYFGRSLSESFPWSWRAR